MVWEWSEGGSVTVWGWLGSGLEVSLWWSEGGSMVVWGSFVVVWGWLGNGLWWLNSGLVVVHR